MSSRQKDKGKEEESSPEVHEGVLLAYGFVGGAPEDKHKKIGRKRYNFAMTLCPQEGDPENKDFYIKLYGAISSELWFHYVSARIPEYIGGKMRIKMSPRSPPPGSSYQEYVNLEFLDLSPEEREITPHYAGLTQRIRALELEISDLKKGE
jgi:hypothetical protein